MRNYGELSSNQKIFISLSLLVIFLSIYFSTLYLKIDNLKAYAYGLSAFIGFYFAVVVGHYLIAEIVDKMWIAETGIKGDPESTLNTSAIIGWVERPFYIVFLLLGKPEVIGFWLTIKTAGRIWGEERPAKFPPARTIYQIFLIGNALSIGYAVIGWEIIEWLPRTPISAILSILALCISSLYLRHKIPNGDETRWLIQILDYVLHNDC